MLEGRRSHRTLTRVFLGVTATTALLVALVTTLLTVQWVQLRDVGTDDTFRRADPSGEPGAETGRCSRQPCNYLLLGSDSRRGFSLEQVPPTIDGEPPTSRADTVMLVHIDPVRQRAIVLSFPRDLWVRIPGLGFDRINAAFEGGLQNGGPQLMAQTVANLTGLAIDHYLYVDLAGFQRIVDTMGGVAMCIPSYNVNTPGWLTHTVSPGESEQVYYDEIGHIADPDAHLNIEPGCQHLNGTEALAYVRARHLPCDHIPDFARIGRQQQFLRAVINQLLRPAMAVKAPSLISPILESLRRDKGFLPSDLVYLAGQLRGVSTGAVEFRAVPGVAAWEGTKSVVRMAPSASRIFAAIREGRPLGSAGTQLLSTPPSEANTSVAVVDVGSQGKVGPVSRSLADAGFDVTPGLWTEDEGPSNVDGNAIVFRPGADAEARVVAAYFPGLPLVESEELRGTQVALVITRSYAPQEPEEGGEPPASECPSTPQ
ncbi:MAG TPA: LCP family protein [Actinomycetota bacterium]|nr:LCP family protein [Actinomycetota bacterium]